MAMDGITQERPALGGSLDRWKRLNRSKTVDTVCQVQGDQQKGRNIPRA